ncbi:AIPR family protein [Mesoplasma lactucae]|uniref:AIPR family protein n=1 Tax=Mesoplasma lactucae TaxID=138853 RepID=UPI001FEF64FC|nr:AIPR family protein [Mesoplasma lactucae]
MKDSTIEEEKNLVDEIVKAANSQKPIKERDLVSNNPEMKELQDVFVQNKTILEIKRGERRSDIENRIKKVYPDFKGKPKNVKNDALGQDILSLFYLKPFEALQKLGKLFNKDLYDKIFNNTYLIPQDYFYIWDFNQWMNEKINELREDLIVGQELNLEDNKKTSNSALFDQTRRWVISTLWLLLWYNKDVKDKLDVKFPSVVEIEELLDNKNDQTFLMKETEMLHPVNLTSDLKKAIIRFIDLCHKNIVTVYNKAKNKDNKSAGLAVTTFSFRRSEFMSFLKELLFDSDRLTDPLQEIVGSFLED